MREKHRNKIICWFEDLNSEEVSVVGGKNASLGEIEETLTLQKSLTINPRSQEHPPVEEPPNEPQKPPVREPGEPPEPPPPPSRPPVEDPPNEPPEPPVKEPPPKDPDREPPQKPPMKLLPNAQRVSLKYTAGLQNPYSGESPDDNRRNANKLKH
jgi:outer membrane biosynthesis protein TonB